MPTINPLQQASADIAYYQAKTDECRDVIKQITGVSPNDIILTFTIKGQRIPTTAFRDDEFEVCCGFFMRMMQHYQQRWREASALLKVLTATRTENFETQL